MNRRGFTLIELMVVTAILGILSAIAVPHYRRYRLDAEAAQAVGDFKVVQHAAYSYFGETDAWPPTGGAGRIPAAMAPYLPGSFSFRRDHYTMQWTSVAIPGLVTLLMLTFTADDPELGRKIGRQLSYGYTTLPGNGGTVHVLMLLEWG